MISARSTPVEPRSPVHPRSVLPAPSGPSAVGRHAIEFVDPVRNEIYSSEPDDRRELVLWIWYPAAADPDGKAAELLPSAWRSIGDFLGLDGQAITSHAISDAPLADEPDAFPVLLLSPSGFSPLLLSATAEELASHGYVVVGINHTYESAVTAFADGRIVPANPAALGGALGPQSGPHEEAFGRRAAVCRYKAADLSSVADHLGRLAPNTIGLTPDRLELSQLGAIGHSFGGNAALEWCRADERCRAAANLDGALWTEVGTLGLPRPALQLLADHPEFAMSGADAVAAGLAPSAEWHDAERTLTVAGWRTIDRLASPGRTVRISGATHLSFMDIPFLPLGDDSPVSPMLAATTIQPERMWRMTNDLLLEYFDQHVRGSDARSVEEFQVDRPEVVFGPP